MKMAMVAAAALALLTLLAMSPAVRSDCNSVTSSLANSCSAYVIGSSSTVPTACCDAVGSALPQLSYTDACTCLDNQLRNLPAQWVAKLKTIPGACNINFDIYSCP
ncbi:hypothetical protein O6H91_21G031200 [Diphasiastrum complanatum]|nr:hypothetical protein O6H91_21G031200 [Diphasiastrum complanatum]